METKWIVCLQCETEFEFDASEQRRYAEKGYDDPRRCPSCRKHKTKVLDAWEMGELKGRKKKYRYRGERHQRRLDHAEA